MNGEILTPRSRSGTTSTVRDETGFGYKAICAIITSCHSAGVRKLTFGDLEVEFGPSQVPDSAEVPEYANGEPYNDIDLARHHEKMGGTSGAGAVLMTEAQKAHLEELALNNLMMDDPLAYEEKMIAAQFSGNDVV